jgi:hypothetical protein
MESLLKYELKDIPDNYELKCYYIVDNDLQYVSLSEDGYLYLHFVDTNQVGETIMYSTSHGDLDKYVYNINKPIVSMKCSYDIVNEKESRVVRIVSVSGNPKCRKHKEVSERTVYNRYQNKGKKLF